MSHRLVGSGAGINQHQTEGLDEGWSDFYALALSSESTDNIRGTYQFAGFAGYKYTSPTFLENYYFGIRPYPCSIDMAKDPMTLGDLYSSPNGVGDPHPGIPLNPISSGFLNEEHAFGQVWCAALWDARANLIQQHGYTNGNWLALQLVTDGMKLGPANPTFLQARDAVLVADLAYTGGKNALELWTAFAKRGMGYYATNAPSNFMDDDGLIPVRESFTIPPFVEITNGIYSSPAIGADGTVYVGSANGRLYAISREGNIQWAFGGLTTNQPFNSSPVVGPLNVIYAGCNDSNLYALAGGALLWRTNLGGQVFSSPALATDGTIYAGSANGKLYAVNPDGTVKWSANVTSSILSSPAVALDGTVYAGSLGASNNLHAFNPTNGAVLAGWPVTVGGGVYSSPALASDGSVVVGGLDGKVYAFTAGGSARSGWPFTTGGAVYSSPAIGPDGRVYVGSSDTNLYALNPDGTTNWTYRAGGAVNSSPALGRDGTVFVGAEDGQLHVVNADGTGRWSYPVGGPVFSSPVIGLNGGLYVGSVGGNLYFLPTGTPFGDGAWPMFRQNFQHTANGRRVIIRPSQMTGGSFKFEISGPAGAACTVEATTNLPAVWSFFSTQTLTNGVGLVETGATNANRYFRAGIP